MYPSRLESGRICATQISGKLNIAISLMKICCCMPSSSWWSSSLSKLGSFRPKAPCFFWAFKTNPLTLRTWSSDSWKTLGCNIKLGVVDFLCIPGATRKSKSFVEKPYFEEFVKLISSKGQLGLTDLPAWLFICRDNKTYMQFEAFAKKPPLLELYDLYPSEYVPAPNEHLGGHLAKSKLVTGNVHLLFFIKSESDHPPRVKKVYQSPQYVVYEKPQKYNEVQYAMYPIDLRMMFFIKILDLFYKPGVFLFQFVW